MTTASTPPVGAYAGVLVDSEPAVDGIFRAVPHGLSDTASMSGGVSVSKTGRWVVSLNLAGELYQALFDTQVWTWVWTWVWRREGWG